jgi:hypothetical protein
MYIVAFQRPGEADALLGADVARTMDMFLRRPVPGVPNTSKGLGEEVKEGESAFALHKAVADYDPANDPRERFLTDAEFAVFVRAFERTGFTGGSTGTATSRATGSAQQTCRPTLRAPPA